MTNLLLAWYFSCIGYSGYDYHSDKVCSAEFRTFERALNYRVAGWYDVPFRDKRW